MPLADNLTLDDVAGVDVVYNLISRSGLTSTRLDAASTLAEPREMYISHQAQSSSNGVTTDRHLVSFRKTAYNSKGIPLQAVVNLTVAVPRDAIITTAMVKDLIANLLDFMQDGTLATWAANTNASAVLLNAS